jgi:hypothetical protein
MEGNLAQIGLRYPYPHPREASLDYRYQQLLSALLSSCAVVQTVLGPAPLTRLRM